MTTVHVYMINLKCATNSNYTIMELHDYINFTRCFNGSTELRMRAQYSYLPHGYDCNIPGRLPGDTTLFSRKQTKAPWLTTFGAVASQTTCKQHERCNSTDHQVEADTLNSVNFAQFGGKWCCVIMSRLSL